MVTLFTTDAEHIALADAMQETLCIIIRLLQHLIQDIFSTVVFDDNQNSIRRLWNAKISSRIKHIDIKFHFVRKLIDSGRMGIC